jgi:hypothetical protein
MNFHLLAIANTPFCFRNLQFVLCRTCWGPCAPSIYRVRGPSSPAGTRPPSTMSSVASETEQSERSPSPSEAAESPDTEEFEQPVDSVREVYLISDEDAREHEDAVELVNWSTFEDWKKPWHVVTLWEGSVYDEMTLWGSIPLQNDKLRKVSFFRVCC